MPDPGPDQDPRVRRLLEEQAALRRVATLVAQEVPSSELFGAVAGEVGALLGADFTAMVRYGPDPSFVTTMAFWAAAGEHPPAPSRPRTAPGDPTSRVAATGKPTRVDDWTDVPGSIAEFVRDQLSVRSSVGCPIVVEGGLWGGLAVHAKGGPFRPDTEARLLNFCELVATAIANTNARAEVSRLADEQAALRRVATLVAQGVSPEEVFSVVSTEVGRLFGSGEAAVGRYEPEGSSVVYVGISQGLSVIPVGTRWPLEEFLASTTVYRTGRPARQEQSDYDTASGQVAEALRELNTVSRVGAPIFVEGKLWGVLLVTDTRERLPSDTEERVEKFTVLLATAIANAESRAELAASEARAHELAREQAALRRVATLVAKGASADALFRVVAEEVADVLGVPVVGLHRYEADGTFTMMGIAGETGFTVGSRWPVEDEGLAGMILATGRPARKEDYATMPGALGAPGSDDRMVATVGVPIIVEGGVWGFIVGAARPGKPIPPNMEGRLARFTELVATAIADSQAREHLAQLADEQAALRRVATLVAQGVSPTELFSAVSYEVGRLFGAEATVSRYEAGGSAVMVVGQTPGIPVVGVGDRWELDDLMATSIVYRTGQSGRNDWTGLENVSGLTGERLRAMNFTSTVVAPVVVEGELWGVIAVSHKHERLPPDTEERVERFTDLLATAIANADSREELAASRARIVAAGDDARRRIERDLHDGAQQRLVTLAVALRRVEANVPSGSDEHRADVNRVAEGLISAIEELRELSQGIHPAELTEGGLSPALKALGRRSAIRVELDVSFEDRLPDQVEVAAYYTVSEALTNASKHSDAKRVWVSLDVVDYVLRLSIRDDGVGGADASLGSGLTGLRDRIEALGGRLHIESPRGSGTRIEVEIPAGQSTD